MIDVTPFLIYFAKNIYNKIEAKNRTQLNLLEIFNAALKNGKITEKEKELWNFALSAYGQNEFSTKQLERDFQNAAYATIRSFVLKFTRLQLLTTVSYGNRIKYKINLG